MNNNYHYKRNNITKDEVNELAEGREDKLHYDIITYIKKKYPDAITIAGLGEHLTTVHSRIDATNKGYKKGQPDIMIIRGLTNGFQDILAIEIKNPNGNNKITKSQKEYHEILKQNCNIETIVGYIYEDIIIDIHEHYKKTSTTNLNITVQTNKISSISITLL